MSFEVNFLKSVGRSPKDIQLISGSCLFHLLDKYFCCDELNMHSWLQKSMWGLQIVSLFSSNSAENVLNYQKVYGMVFSQVSGLRKVLKLLKQLFNELLERRMQLKTFEFNSLFIHCTDPNQLQTITPSLPTAGGLLAQPALLRQQAPFTAAALAI